MIVFSDSFDKYGGNVAFMLDGLWSATPFAGLATSPAPPHGTWVLNLNIDGANQARFPLPDPTVSFGCGARYYWPSLPSSNNFQTMIATFNDIANARLVTAWIATTGAVIVTDQDSVVLGQTAGPVITANGWHHIECFTTIDDSGAGVFQLAVDGAVKLNLSGLSMSDEADIAQIVFGRVGGGGGAGFYMKDLYLYDTSGVRNNAFPVGDMQVLLLTVDGDGSNQQWTPSTPPAWQQVNETPPDDADYISQDTTGLPKKSSFTFANLPADATGVHAVQVTGRQWKSDAGTATLKQGVISNGAEAFGTDRPISTLPTYYWDVFETDPDTGATWGVTAVNAAQVQVDRTT